MLSFVNSISSYTMSSLLRSTRSNCNVYPEKKTTILWVQFCTLLIAASSFLTLPYISLFEITADRNISNYRSSLSPSPSLPPPCSLFPTGSNACSLSSPFQSGPNLHLVSFFGIFTTETFKKYFWKRPWKVIWFILCCKAKKKKKQNNYNLYPTNWPFNLCLKYRNSAGLQVICYRCHWFTTKKFSKHPIGILLSAF